MKSKPKHIYIAGKISGLSEEVYTSNFSLACWMLEIGGYVPVNPVEICKDIKDGKWEDYMDRCLSVLLKCDGIYLLKDWKDSIGATLEKEVANALEKVKDFVIMYQQ